MMQSPESVLITGGAGFMGLHLARRLLADGVAVGLIDRRFDPADAELAETLAHPNCRHFTLDLMEAGAPGALDTVGACWRAVVHFAARLGVADVRSKPTAVLRDNVRLTEIAIDVAHGQRDFACFLLASTSEVYSASLEAGLIAAPFAETAVLATPDLREPRSSYALSKIYSEALVQQAGLSFVIVRPFNIFGPRMGNRHVVPQLVERITAAAGAGEPVAVYSPAHTRTMCYVQDAVAMLQRLLADPAVRGGVYNLGAPGPEIAMADLAAMIRDAVAPEVVLQDGEVTPGSPARRRADVAAVTAATGFGAFTPLADALAETTGWYKAALAARQSP